MSKVSIDLHCQTDPNWVHTVLENFDAFLQDHANCERKASAMAMSFVIKYADRTKILPELIELAQEELEHFGQVYELMEKRGLTLGKEEKDPYVNALIKLCRSDREGRFIDRMLIASIVECRGAERFRLIYEALNEPDLKEFYHRLWASEAKHGNLFVKLLLHYYPAETLYPRLEELMAEEAKIIKNLPWRASLH